MGDLTDMMNAQMDDDRPEELARLLPCPFCGGEATLNDYTDKPVGAWVLAHKVNGCIFRLTGSYRSSDAAIAAWNRRTPDADLLTARSQIEALEAREAAALARVRVLEEAQSWQPIDTAPKDGTEILVCYAPSGYDPDFSIARWDGSKWAARCDGMNVIEYMSDFGTEYLTVFAKHWMPLPAAPALNQEVGG